MSKHTPGPWYADSVAREWGFKAPVLMARVTREAEKDGLRLPVVWADPRYVRYEETMANARLIAAAPDLLEALEQLLKWAPHFVMLATPGSEGRSLVYAGDVEAARAAIAKARGEDQ